jgi:folate-binding protein YgfZ
MNDNGPSDFDQEYRALRSGQAIVNLHDWSSLSITGADRTAFLHNFCTNDIKRLSPGESCEAFFTNVKGKIIGHGVVSGRENELVFFGAPGQAPRLVELLDRYIIREDVAVRNTTSEKVFVLITGKRSDSKGRWTAFSWNLVGNETSRIVEFAAQAGLPIASVFGNGEFVAAGIQAFTAARIEAGLPLYGVDFDENNLPQEVGRDRQAISFTKGCYLGQETVARIDALGHVNQRIVGVAFSGHEVPPVGTELMRQGAKVGRVTSAVMSPALGRPLALAMVRREANSDGTRLASNFGEATVVALPVNSRSGA